MPPADHSLVYEAILLYIKNKGIKIIHRTIRTGAGGTFAADKKIITIDKAARNTLNGCFYLCHEFIHYKQHVNNEFPGFFNITGEYTREKMDLIIRAEIDADKRGSKLLMGWGLDYSPASLEEDGLVGHIKFWKKYYFNLSS